MYEYSIMIEEFDRQTTTARVNKMAAEGWRLVNIQRNVYWFERALAEGATHPGTVTEEEKTVAKKKKNAAAGK